MNEDIFTGYDKTTGRTVTGTKAEVEAAFGRDFRLFDGFFFATMDSAGASAPYYYYTNVDEPDRWGSTRCGLCRYLVSAHDWIAVAVDGEVIRCAQTSREGWYDRNSEDGIAVRETGETETIVALWSGSTTVGSIRDVTREMVDRGDPGPPECPPERPTAAFVRRGNTLVQAWVYPACLADRLHVVARTIEGDEVVAVADYLYPPS